MTAAETLRDYLASSYDIEHHVGDRLYVGDEYEQVRGDGKTAIVVAGNDNQFFIYYLAADHVDRCLMADAIRSRIGELPLAEVVESVKYADGSHSGRIAVTADMGI